MIRSSIISYTRQALATPYSSMSTGIIMLLLTSSLKQLSPISQELLPRFSATKPSATQSRTRCLLESHNPQETCLHTINKALDMKADHYNLDAIYFSCYPKSCIFQVLNPQNCTHDTIHTLCECCVGYTSMAIVMIANGIPPHFFKIFFVTSSSSE